MSASRTPPVPNTPMLDIGSHGPSIWHLSLRLEAVSSFSGEISHGRKSGLKHYVKGVFGGHRRNLCGRVNFLPEWPEAYSAPRSHPHVRGQRIRMAFSGRTERIRVHTKVVRQCDELCGLGQNGRTGSRAGNDGIAGEVGDKGAARPLIYRFRGSFEQPRT